MDLTNAEIEKLFIFTSRKYVRYIDVQIELVDHLASAIEERKIEDSRLGFDEALQKVYSEFPISGFSNLINEKTKSLNIFWLKKLKSYFIGFLNWPKILWLMLFFMGFYTLSFIASYKVFFGVVLFMIWLLCIAEAYTIWTSEVFSKLNITKFLALTTYYNVGFWCIYFPSSMFIIFQIQNETVFTENSRLIICILLSIYTVAIYGITRVFPNQIKSDIMDRYKDFINLST